jgi:hypothetical protein
MVIPGGRAPEYIRNDADVQRIVRHFMGTDHPGWMREFIQILRSKAPV